MPLPHSSLLELKRWNTPTIYNGWEQITQSDASRDGVNLEPTTDYMPHMGPMVGYAVTVKIEPSNPSHAENHPNAWSAYWGYLAEVPGPKIVVVQDLDKPHAVGAFWGEVNSNVHRALGCVGTITDGSIRDTDEMCNAGFKALARCLGVGHAYSTPIVWNCEVEVFGRRIQPGQLIHADKHGFLAIPKEDEDALLDAAVFMDRNECETWIAAARSTSGKTTQQILTDLKAASQRFSANTRQQFRRTGEWQSQE